uniref:Peptidase S1 domain-containing protein n=1 Tax=Timema monikensis TaxID=170555 RepID=A0A7R9E0P4_9NEOP|nr:unnamed protein product [Timema monikensis]
MLVVLGEPSTESRVKDSRRWRIAGRTPLEGKFALPCKHTILVEGEIPDLEWGTHTTAGHNISSDTLTAHCLRYRERVELTIETLVVYLGRFNLKKFSEQDAQQVELEQLAIHPDYDSYKYDADLAVLVMKRSIVYNTFIQPICLWDRSPNLGPIVGKFGTVVGWGRDENGNKVTPKPRMAQIPIVTQEECLRSKNDFVFLTSNRTFCAGSRNGTGPCNGDSGSGFILPLPDGTGGKRWYLRGVTGSKPETQSSTLRTQLCVNISTKPIGAIKLGWSPKRRLKGDGIFNYCEKRMA